LGQAALDVAYRFDGPAGLPLEGWWYAHKIGRTWSAVGIRDVVARFEGSDPVQFGPASIADDDVEPMLGQPLAFIGVDAQYFSAVLLPQKPSLDTMWIDEVRTILIGHQPKNSTDARFSNVTCRLISQTKNLAAGAALKHSYTVFTGPKRPELLAKYHASEEQFYSLSDLLYYGWFTVVAKWMLWILHTFYGMVGNYGIAIILLTVLVRSCLFPLSRKQALSMARMQELKPEMDKLKEKYKSDMQKQSQAMQELYRKHKINPMAGCLPMFIQLPIMLGLYRALMVDVELRQAPLLSESIRWCSNLAAPDMLWDWSSLMPDIVNRGEGIFSLGPYLNVLPLITCALFVLQQKIFMPEPANEQAAMQQKIMKYMMLAMGVLFFKVAAGLCIYFIASSLWGIAERKLVPPATAKTGIASGPATDSPSSRRSSSERNGQSKRKGKRSGKSKKKR
jgi:YidC/Oxa1 family membrane protein insertase